MRLPRANVIAYCFNASVAVCFELYARGASYPLCQRRFRIVDNSRDMDYRLRGERTCLAERISEPIPACLVAVLARALIHHVSSRLCCA